MASPISGSTPLPPPLPGSGAAPTMHSGLSPSAEERWAKFLGPTATPADVAKFISQLNSAIAQTIQNDSKKAKEASDKLKKALTGDDSE